MNYSIIYLNKTSQMGGAEISLFHILRMLSGDRFRFQVILPSEGVFTQRLQMYGIPFRIIRMRRIRISLNPIFYLLLLFELIYLTLCLMVVIKREKRRKSMGIICANSLYDCIYAVPAAKLTRTPLICHIREIIPDGWKWRMWLIFLYLTSNKIVAVSNAVKERIAQNRGAFNKTEIIYTGVDIEQFSSGVQSGYILRRQFKLIDKLLIVNIGSLTFWKGQDLFLKAASKIRYSFPQAKFMIVGTVLYDKDISYFEYLKRLTGSLGIDKEVIFTGWRNDIAKILTICDLYVHSAISPDPFPRVLLEAMACGKAVIAPYCGGIPELIHDNINGVLYPPGDIEAMSAAISSLLEDKEKRLRLGLTASRYVRERFNIRKHLVEMEDLYQRVCA